MAKIAVSLREEVCIMTAYGNFYFTNIVIGRSILTLENHLEV